MRASHALGMTLHFTGLAMTWVLALVGPPGTSTLVLSSGFALVCLVGLWLLGRR